MLEKDAPTGCGRVESSTPSFPSWPTRLKPQHQAAPSKVSPQVCRPPALTSANATWPPTLIRSASGLPVRSKGAVAVLGCGVDVWYPRANARLGEEILAGRSDEVGQMAGAFQAMTRQSLASRSICAFHEREELALKGHDVRVGGVLQAVNHQRLG